MRNACHNQLALGSRHRTRRAGAIAVSPLIASQDAHIPALHVPEIQLTDLTIPAFGAIPYQIGINILGDIIAATPIVVGSTQQCATTHPRTGSQSRALHRLGSRRLGQGADQQSGRVRHGAAGRSGRRPGAGARSADRDRGCGARATAFTATLAQSGDLVDALNAGRAPIEQSVDAALTDLTIKIDTGPARVYADLTAGPSVTTSPIPTVPPPTAAASARASKTVSSGKTIGGTGKSGAAKKGSVGSSKRPHKAHSAG